MWAQKTIRQFLIPWKKRRQTFLTFWLGQKCRPALEQACVLLSWLGGGLDYSFELYVLPPCFGGSLRSLWEPYSRTVVRLAFLFSDIIASSPFFCRIQRQTPNALWNSMFLECYMLNYASASLFLNISSHARFCQVAIVFKQEKYKTKDCVARLGWKCLEMLETLSEERAFVEYHAMTAKIVCKICFWKIS